MAAAAGTRRSRSPGGYAYDGAIKLSGIYLHRDAGCGLNWTGNDVGALAHGVIVISASLFTLSSLSVSSAMC